MTVFNWGESPIGKWKLKIETRPRRDKSKENVGHLDHFSVNFFGFKNTQRINKRFTEKTRAFIPSNDIIEKIYKTELDLSRETIIINKRVLDSNPEFRHILKSIE
jgi:subtilisin-like proprotein convertase family protein